MASTQELTRRIKSIKSTRKITRAMQLVSAAKMRKAQNATRASRSYASLTQQLIASVQSLEDPPQGLFNEFPNAEKVGVLLITTNRGLVGSFNTNLLGSVLKHLSQPPQLLSELIVIGKKGREAALRTGQVIVAEFDKAETTLRIRDIYALSHLVNDTYQTGQYRQILIVYNEFISTLVQKPVVRVLLPLPKNNGADSTLREALLEPTRQEVIAQLLPRIF